LADHGVRPAGEDGSAEPDDGKRMHLLEHIGELRRRLLYVLAVFVAGLVLGLLAADPVYGYLMSVEPANKLASLHVFSLWDGIGMYMKIAFVIALLIALPFAFHQLWAFVSPGLKARERKAALGYVPLAFVMLAAGLAFSYFVVFPLAFDFTTHVSQRLGLEETYGIAQYFSFMFNIIVPISLLFELPTSRHVPDADRHSEPAAAAQDAPVRLFRAHLRRRARDAAGFRLGPARRAAAHSAL